MIASEWSGKYVWNLWRKIFSTHIKRRESNKRKVWSVWSEVDWLIITKQRGKILQFQKTSTFQNQISKMEKAWKLEKQRSQHLFQGNLMVRERERDLKWRTFITFVPFSESSNTNKSILNNSKTVVLRNQRRLLSEDYVFLVLFSILNSAEFKLCGDLILKPLSLFTARKEA